MQDGSADTNDTPSECGEHHQGGDVNAKALVYVRFRRAVEFGFETCQSGIFLFGQTMTPFQRMMECCMYAACLRTAVLTRNAAVVALLHAIVPDALSRVNLHKTVGTVCRVYGAAQTILGGICGQRFKVGWPPEVLSEPPG
jgi:hypothetical protein